MSPAGGLPFELHGTLPALHQPVLLVQLTGWIDASGAANAAMEHITRVTDSKELLTFDGDTFIDYRARRPVMELREGVNTRIVWGAPGLRVGTDGDGKDVVILSGPEPDTAWRFFARTVGELAAELGVTKMIALGAYPYGAPHTRPVGLSSTTPSETIAKRLRHARNSLDAPAGVAAVLEHELHGRGIEAMGFWAQIPHYVATMQFSAASIALIDAVRGETGLVIDTTLLLEEAVSQRERLDNLIGGNPEPAEMISKLEQAYDAAFRPSAPQIATDLPSAEQLAEEIEKFLREQQSGDQQ